MSVNSQLARHNRSWWNSKIIKWSLRWYSCTFASRSHFLCLQNTGAQSCLTNIHIQSWREGAKGREPSGARTRGNGHKLRSMRFPLNIRKQFGSSECCGACPTTGDLCDTASSRVARDGPATTPQGICGTHREALWSWEHNGGVVVRHSHKEGTGTAEVPKLKVFIK